MLEVPTCHHNSTCPFLPSPDFHRACHCTLLSQPGQPNTLEGLWNQELKKIVSGSTGGDGSAAAPRLPVPAEDKKEPSESTEAPAETIVKAPEAKPMHRHKEGEVQAEPEVLLRKGSMSEDTSSDRIIEDDDDEESDNKRSSKKVGAAWGQSLLSTLERGSLPTCHV